MTTGDKTGGIKIYCHLQVLDTLLLRKDDLHQGQGSGLSLFRRDTIMESSANFKKFVFLHIKSYNKDIYDHAQCSTALL